MKFKYYLRYITSKYLPFIVILSAFLLFTTIITISEADFYSVTYEYNEGYYHTYTYVTTGLDEFIFFFYIVLTFLPFFGMNYQYSLKASDMYRQVATDTKKIRLFHHLFILTVTVIIFTVAYLFLAIGLLFRYANYTVPTSNCEIITPYFIYYLPMYFLILLFGLLQYGVSYLFISRGTTKLTSTLMFIAGHVILMIFIYTPALYLQSVFHSDIFDYISIYTNSSDLMVNTFVFEIANNLVINGSLNSLTFALPYYVSNEALYYCVMAFAIIVFIAIGTLGIVSLFIEKDAPAEYAGKVGSPKPYQEIIFHTCAFFVGLFIAYTNYFVSYIFLNIVSVIFDLFIFYALYYVLYSLLYKNFKMPIKKYIPLFTISGVILLLTIISVTVNIYS